MEYLIGTGLALVICLAATGVGLDRDRAFYTVMAMVVPTYYGLFAILAGSTQALMTEGVGIAVAIALSIIGFRSTLWLVAAVLAGHGVFDAFHGQMIDNPGVPAWWPGFCGSYDVVAGLFLAWRLGRGTIPAGRAPAKPSATRFPDRIRPYVQAEIEAARESEAHGEAKRGFGHLERAHVLGQYSTREHVRAHWNMLTWAIRQRHPAEVAAQVFRLPGAVTKTWIGLLPEGNTGGGNVSAIKPMPIDPDLDAILRSARARPGAR